MEAEVDRLVTLNSVPRDLEPVHLPAPTDGQDGVLTTLTTFVAPDIVCSAQQRGGLFGPAAQRRATGSSFGRNPVVTATTYAPTAVRQDRAPHLPGALRTLAGGLRCSPFASGSAAPPGQGPSTVDLLLRAQATFLTVAIIGVALASAGSNSPV